MSAKPALIQRVNLPEGLSIEQEEALAAVCFLEDLSKMTLFWGRQRQIFDALVQKRGKALDPETDASEKKAANTLISAMVAFEQFIAAFVSATPENQRNMRYAFEAGSQIMEHKVYRERLSDGAPNKDDENAALLDGAIARWQTEHGGTEARPKWKDFWRCILMEKAVAEQSETKKRPLSERTARRLFEKPWRLRIKVNCANGAVT